MAKLAIEIETSIDAAADAWQSCYTAADAYAYQSPTWLATWARIAASRLQVSPYFVQVRGADRQLLMLLPLALGHSAGARLLSWLGGDLADYQGPLLHPRFADYVDAGEFSALWSEICRQLPPTDAILLENQPAVIGAQANPFAALDGAVPDGTAHAVQLAVGWQRLCDTPPRRKRLADSRRQLRRLAQAGEVRFTIAGQAEQAAALTEDLMRLKSRRYRATGTFDLFGDDVYAEFLRQVTSALWAAGMLHLSALYVGDQLAAVHWGMLERGRFYYLLPAYDRERWGQYSPGRLLLEWLLQWCCEQGVQSFDLTIGDEPYKSAWCDTEMPLYRMLSVRTAGGHLLQSSDAIKDWIRLHPALHRAVNRLRNLRSHR